MIEHAYVQHPVFTTRDQCERKFDDDGRVGFCGRPRSEHMDEVHGLKVQLATALKERDEARHGLNEWCKAAMQERARVTAAESQRDALRALLRGCRPLVAKAHVEADEGTEEGWFDFLRRIDAALAAPADGGDPVIEEVPPHLCGGKDCEECGGPGSEHADTCSCREVL